MDMMDSEPQRLSMTDDDMNFEKKQPTGEQTIKLTGDRGSLGT